MKQFDNSADNKINKYTSDKSIQNNSIYDNLNIYEEQNNIYIKFIYDVSYLNYKKKIFLEINDNYNLIINLFNNDICDILINIYILRKKNKIDNTQFDIIKQIFDYIKKLNEIIFIDSENFFISLIDFYKINILSVWTNAFFQKNIFGELIKYKVLVAQINNLFLNISKKILLFKIFDELVEMNYNKGENYNDLIKQKITYLAEKMAFDLFMFYNSGEIFSMIMGCLTYFDDIILRDNDLDNLKFLKTYHTDIIEKNKILSEIFKKNKTIFTDEYDKSSTKYIEIYSNDVELYVKFKIAKSEIINKFIANISYIDSI
jgi:hypothetical protein